MRSRILWRTGSSGKRKALLPSGTVGPDHQGGVDGEVGKQPGLPRGFGLGFEGEGARGGDLGGVVFVAAQVEGAQLPADDGAGAGVVQLVDDLHAVVVGGQRGDHGVVFTDHHGRFDFEEASFGVLGFAAGQFERFIELQRAAVHGGHFGAVELDDEVVDVVGGDGGEAVLAGVDGGFAGLEGAAAGPLDDVLDVRGHGGAVEVHAFEDHAVVGGGRAKGDRGGLAEEQPGPVQGLGLRDGVLLDHQEGRRSGAETGMKAGLEVATAIGRRNSDAISRRRFAAAADGTFSSGPAADGRRPSRGRRRGCRGRGSRPIWLWPVRLRR